MEDHLKIVAAKTSSFTICSPLDTFRQNMLIKNRLKISNFKNGILFSSLNGFTISATCHSIIYFCEQHKINFYLSIFLGVLAASIVKTPIVYNYRRIQTGMKPMLKMSKLKNTFKINFIEDCFEEGLKYTMAKHMFDKKTYNPNPIYNSTVLFSLTYPFDIIKNKSIYERTLYCGKNDFLIKLVNKNIQNICFFQSMTVLNKKDSSVKYV